MDPCVTRSPCCPSLHHAGQVRGGHVCNHAAPGPAAHHGAGEPSPGSLPAMRALPACALVLQQETLQGTRVLTMPRPSANRCRAGAPGGAAMAAQHAGQLEARLREHAALLCPPCLACSCCAFLASPCFLRLTPPPPCVLQSGQPVIAQLPGAPPVPASYLQNQWWRRLATPLPPALPPPAGCRMAAEPPNRAEARPAPTAAGAAAAAPPPPPMGSARSEPFAAPARGPAGAAWPPPMGAAPSAPLYPSLAPAAPLYPKIATGAGSGSSSGTPTPGTPSPAQSGVRLSG